MKTITILHPSRGRAEMASKTINTWMNNADNPSDIDYILSLDDNDPELDEYKDKLLGSDVYFLMSPNKSAIEAINVAAKQATGDLLIVVSDDFDCPPHWDTLLLQAIKDKEDFLVKTQDGIQKTLITLPILDRKYYDRFGYVYHPDYSHMHADEEMTIVGHMLGRVINLPLVFSHLHYTTGAMQKDAINDKNNRTWGHGQATLDRRAKDNFGIANPLIQRKDIVWK